MTSAGSAIGLYGTIRALDKSAATKDYQGAITAGLITAATGLVTKLLTKAAAYKAVDVFNGAVTKKIKDIFSIQPASSTIGMGKCRYGGGGREPTYSPPRFRDRHMSEGCLRRP